MRCHNDKPKTNERLSNQARTLISDDKTFYNDSKILVNLTPNGLHILLLYEDENDLMTSIKTYLNEGIRREELCIHATVNIMNENYIHDFTSQIEDDQKNKKDGNLLMLNLKSYYKKATEGNLKPFDKLAQIVMNYPKRYGTHQLDKEARIIHDCGSQLFKNGYFDQCTDLEAWWHKKPFAGSFLCIYPKSLFDSFPNDLYLSTLVQCHDIVVDTQGRKVTEKLKS
jgi:hypothetical protein